MRVGRSRKVLARMLTVLLGLAAAACDQTGSSGPSPQPGPTGPAYYVDNCVVVGSDNNNGTSPFAPWLTVNKVNTSTFNPGDSVLFESTCTWREQLTVPSSGSAGKPITFGAYGSGAQPIISGANLLTSWTSESEGTFTAYYASTSLQPNQVFQNGVRYTLASAKASMVPGSWWWDSVNLHVYVRTSGDNSPSGYTIEASQRNNAVNVPTSYVTIQGLRLTASNQQAIWQTGSAAQMTVSGSTIDRAYYQGILTSADLARPYTDEISYNSISLCGGSGIEVNNYAQSITIEHNTIFSNALLYTGTGMGSDPKLEWLAGIRAVGQSLFNVVVQYNVIYSNGPPSYTTDNAGNGIWFDTIQDANTVARYNLVYGNISSGIMIENGNSNVVMYNVSCSNGKAGILLSNSSGLATHNQGIGVYNNTLYGNNTAATGYGGLTLEGQSPLTASTCTSNLVKNNISFGNTGANLLAMRGCSNDGTYGSGNVYTYNDFGAQGSNFIEWGVNSGTYYSTYSAWETATGNCGTAGCSHSVQSAPAFANASADQFWLTSGSPGIDAGTNLGSPYDIGLLPGSSWPNLVLTGNQNSYGTGWEVGAYIFTGQPNPLTGLHAIVF